MNNKDLLVSMSITSLATCVLMVITFLGYLIVELLLLRATARGVTKERGSP